MEIFNTIHRRVFVILTLLLSGMGIACDKRADSTDASRLPPAAALREVSLVNLAGEKVPALRSPDTKATVLLFLNVDCPISNRYAPEVRRLHALFAAQHIAFLLVYPGPDTSAEEVREHFRKFDLPGEALRDPQLSLARATQVRATPEAVMVLPDGQVAYRGRIDDRFVDLAKQRPSPTRHDLEEALKEILADKPVSHPNTKAVGCRIQGLP